MFQLTPSSTPALNDLSSLLGLLSDPEAAQKALDNLKTATAAAASATAEARAEQAKADQAQKQIEAQSADLSFARGKGRSA